MSIIMRDWRDLEHFGIAYLTGEACALGLRALCDVSPTGKKILVETLGLHEGSILLPEPYNTTPAFKKVYRNGYQGNYVADHLQFNPEEPHVGSLKIPHDLRGSLILTGMFVHLKANVVLQVGNGGSGFMALFISDLDADYPTFAKLVERIQSIYGPAYQRTWTPINFKDVDWRRNNPEAERNTQPTVGIDCVHAITGRVK